MSASAPIFVHSLFRSASTYFFQKFRSFGRQFTCFQEPFNESLTALNDCARQYRLLESPHGSPLRHPHLDRPYFYEFWTNRSQLQGLFREEFAYHQYFPDESGRLPASQIRYLETLLSCAQGRPVLQFCRSSGRAGPLRRTFGGMHVHLWREPRAQWWSYKVADYFDSVSQRIYRAEHLPEALQALRRLAVAPADSPVRLLRPRENYLLFYGLWLDAWLRLQSHADLSINIDAIGLSGSENAGCSRVLGALVGRSLDLSDLRACGMAFTPEEEAFYGEVESAVNAVFVQTRRGTAHSVKTASDAACRARRLHEAARHDAITERNVRQAALVMMERLAALERLHRLSWAARLGQRVRTRWERLRRGPRLLELNSSNAPGTVQLAASASRTRLR